MADPHISGPQLRSSRKKSENTSSVSLASAQAGNADVSFQQGADAEISESTSVDFEHLSCHENVDENVEKNVDEVDENDSGQCEKCRRAVRQELECDRCFRKYHLRCAKVPKSHFVIYDELHESGFTWECAICKENKKEEKNEQQSGYKDLQQFKTELIAEMKEIFSGMIKTEMQRIENPNKPEQNTSNENDVKHALLLQPKGGDQTKFSQESWSDIVQKCITVKLNDVPVKKAVLTTKGTGYIILPNAESRDIAAKTLKPDCKVTTQDKNIKSVYPKIRIHGIPKEKFDKTNKNILREELIKKIRS